MQLSDLFEPIDTPSGCSQYMPEEDSIKSQIEYGFSGMGHVEDDISNFDVAIIGIADGKNALGNEGSKDASDIIRAHLTGLRKISKSLKIIDLGNIRGNTLNDRYFAVFEAVKILSSKGVCSLIIGGAQDYILPVTKGIVENYEDPILSIIDAKLDFNVNDNDFSSQTFLSQLEKEYKNQIFDLNLLGGQNYLIGESQEKQLLELNWHLTRLKDLRNEFISRGEPLLRDSDLVSFDVGCIQKNYMPYFSNINVNGFTGYEACQLGWYAGVSDCIKSFCLQEYNPNIDKTGKGAMLCAEILWHFMEGISQYMSRLCDFESGEYKISVVHLQDFDVDIRFYSNRVNNRWWIEVPWKDKVKVLACNKSDYLLAQNGELPDKWWRFYQQGI